MPAPVDLEHDTKYGTEEQLETTFNDKEVDNVIDSDHAQYIHDASGAVEVQKNQPIWSTLSQYRYGVMFSIIFSS
jgi:hypothetical protein